MQARLLFMITLFPTEQCFQIIKKTGGLKVLLKQKFPTVEKNAFLHYPHASSIYYALAQAALQTQNKCPNNQSNLFLLIITMDQDLVFSIPDCLNTNEIDYQIRFSKNSCCIEWTYLNEAALIQLYSATITAIFVIWTFIPNGTGLRANIILLFAIDKLNSVMAQQAHCILPAFFLAYP